MLHSSPEVMWNALRCRLDTVSHDAPDPLLACLNRPTHLFFPIGKCSFSLVLKQKVYCCWLGRISLVMRFYCSTLMFECSQIYMSKISFCVLSILICIILLGMLFLTSWIMNFFSFFVFSFIFCITFVLVSNLIERQFLKMTIKAGD